MEELFCSRAGDEQVVSPVFYFPLTDISIKGQRG